MRLKKILPFFIVTVFISCTTTGIKSFLVGEGVVQYFLPPTEWIARDSEVLIDFIYRTNTDIQATVNISFFGNKSTPQNVRFVSLHGSDADCLLEGISILLVRAEKNELRITSSGDRDMLISVFRSEPITLKTEVDGITYTYTPGKNFTKIKDEFLSELLF